MSRLLIFASGAAFLLAMPAQAGFEWIPPSGKAPTAENYRAAPIENKNGFEANMVPMPDKQVLPALSAPMMPMPDTVPLPDNASNPPMESIKWDDMAPVPAAPSMPTKNPDIIEGFGRDMPLTIATRQIVPSSYVVQYGQGVDPNMSVNWSGGRVWKDALMDSLAEEELKATIVGDTVLIDTIAPIEIANVSAVVSPIPAPAVMNNPNMPPLAEVMVPPAAVPTQMALAASNTASFMPKNITMKDAPAPMPAPQTWVATRASTLRQVLTDWCRDANVQLQWSSQYDYPLMSDVQISGSFESATETLLSGLTDAQPRPIARLHPNDPTGPSILVVETRYILE